MRAAWKAAFHSVIRFMAWLLRRAADESLVIQLADLRQELASEKSKRTIVEYEVELLHGKLRRIQEHDKTDAEISVIRRGLVRREEEARPE